MAEVSRIPPSSPEAEKSILGSMLLSERCVCDALGALSAEDFSSRGTGISSTRCRTFLQRAFPWISLLSRKNWSKWEKCSLGAWNTFRT